MEIAVIHSRCKIDQNVIEGGGAVQGEIRIGRSFGMRPKGDA
jgi:hypothetical protein